MDQGETITITYDVEVTGDSDEEIQNGVLSAGYSTVTGSPVPGGCEDTAQAGCFTIHRITDEIDDPTTPSDGGSGNLGDGTESPQTGIPYTPIVFAIISVSLLILAAGILLLRHIRSRSLS